MNPPNEDVHKFVQSNVAHNAKELQYIRSCFAAIAGSTAGILGLRNWFGFLFYALSWSALCALLMLFKCRGRPSLYLMHGWKDLMLDGAVNALLSYILFHTLLYGLVHLYQ